MRFLSLSQEEINKDYEDVYSYYGEGDTTRYILTALSHLTFFKNKDLSILDFACGKWNRVIPLLRSNGYSIIGYDKYVGGGNEYILDTMPTNTFDLVYSCNFIEHMITPLQTISEMLSLVKDRGYLVYISDGFDYNVPQTHFHTFFFTRKSLQHLESIFPIKLIDYVDLTVNKMAVFQRI